MSIFCSTVTFLDAGEAFKKRVLEGLAASKTHSEGFKDLYTMDSGVSRSAPALIPGLPDTLVCSEILAKLGDDLGPSSFFQLRVLNSGWRDAVNQFPEWDAFVTMKKSVRNHVHWYLKAGRLRAYLLELRKVLGQEPPTTEMSRATYYTFQCGLEEGHITELEFIAAFERAAAGELEAEFDDLGYWSDNNVDESCTQDGA